MPTACGSREEILPEPTEYYILNRDRGFGSVIEALYERTRTEFIVAAYRDGERSFWLIKPELDAIIRSLKKRNVYQFGVTATLLDSDYRPVRTLEGSVSNFSTESQTEGTFVGLLRVWEAEPGTTDPKGEPQ